ncbi:MAG: thiamine pyrophosphate-binding protein [Candidatus Caldarchaeum sp.]
MKVAELVVNCLVECGVKHIFGLSGHTTLELLDAIYNEKRCRFVSVRHEQVAACAADGYARASGRHGVCLAHVGPGNANMVIGIATALRDSSPVLALTCNEDFENLGRDVFQEWDQLSVFKPITKWSAQIRHPAEASRIMRMAMLRCVLGRPGPVQVDLPLDVMSLEVNERHIEKTPRYDLYSSRVRPDPELLKVVSNMLLEAERPLILAGGGTIWSNASEELIRLAEALYIPVAVTHTGRGVIPDTHPLFIGILGRWGHVAAIDACKSSDLILAIGCRLADINTMRWSVISSDAKIIQADIDPNELGRQYPIEVGIVSDAKMFCRDLLEAVGKLSIKGAADRAQRVKMIRDQMSVELDRFFHERSDGKPIKPQRIIKEINQVLNGNYIVTVGAGKHAEYANKVLVKEPRSYLKSVGFGSMGWAYPAALGAKLARPDKTVISLVGDGDFAMTMQDVETAVREDIPVVAVVFNDSCFSSIKRFQADFYGKRFIGVDYRETDFAGMAEIFGADGYRVKESEEIGTSLRRAVKSSRAAVLDVVIDPYEYPPVSWGIIGVKKG